MPWNYILTGGFGGEMATGSMKLFICSLDHWNGSYSLTVQRNTPKLTPIISATLGETNFYCFYTLSHLRYVPRIFISKRVLQVVAYLQSCVCVARDSELNPFVYQDHLQKPAHQFLNGIHFSICSYTLFLNQLFKASIISSFAPYHTVQRNTTMKLFHCSLLVSSFHRN